MNRLAQSPPNGTDGAPCLTGQATGMAWSLLSEISQLLDTLNATGKPGAISLRGLPLTRADRAQLEELLGRGEIRAELDLAGGSEVWETRFAGVWWIRHKGIDDTIACEEIAVTPIPEILMTHPVDIEAAARRLKDELAADSAAARPSNEEHEEEARNAE